MNNYSRALEFCIENNISLNEYESMDLYVTMEGGNTQAIKSYYEYAKKIRTAYHNISKAIKAKDYRQAKIYCKELRNVYNEYLKAINSIDYTTGSNVISQILYSLITVSLALIGPFNKVVSNKKHINKISKLEKQKQNIQDFANNVINNKDKLHIKPNSSDIIKYDYDVINKNIDNSNEKFKKQNKLNIFAAIAAPVTAVLMTIKELKIAREDMKKNGGKIKDINMIRASINDITKKDLQFLAALENHIDKLAKANN